MLITEDYYQRITGDTPASPEVFATAASAAQDLLEDELGRIGLLELGEHTETLPPSAGFVYPTATPVTDGGEWAVRDDALYAGPGTTIDVGTWLGLIDLYDGCEAAYVEVTYTGGYDSTTAPGYMLRDLAAATYAILHPPDLAGTAALPAGATSARVGDVALTWGDGGAGGSSAALLPTITWSPETLRHKVARP